MSEQDASSAPTACRFGDVEVDVRAHAIVKAGQPVAVEPKAFDVLVELLRRHGEAVPRDDLLDRVWGHRHVTPAVLNRVIAMLRRALGDDAEHPHLIRTVHGIGYCFMAPVEWTHAEATPANAPTHLPSARQPAEPMPPPAHWGDRRFVAIGAALVALVAIALAWIAWRPRVPAEPAPATTAVEPRQQSMPGVRTAVLPFALAESKQSSPGLARELQESLAEMLERTPGIALARTGSVRVATEHGLSSAQIGEVLDVGSLVRGTLGGEAGRFQLALELFEPASGAIRWQKTYAERPADLHRMLGAAFRDLHAALLPGTTLREDPALRAVQEAQRLYWEGRRALFEADREGTERAIEAFSRAIELQPDYAIAYVRRAYAWRNLTFSGAMSLDQSYNKARLDLAKAIELDPKLIDAYLGEARMLTAQWRSAEALPVLRRAAAIAPNHPDLQNTWADAEQYHGEPAAAFARRQRIHQTDPYNVWAAMSAGYDQVLMGRREAAKPYFARARELGLADSIVAEREARTALFYGDPVGALEIARRIDRDRSNAYLEDVVVQAQVTLGRLDAARAAIESTPTALPAPPMHADTRLYAFHRAKDYAGARDWLEGAGREAAQQPWIDAFRAHATALTGDDAAALAQYDRLFADPGNRDLVAYAWYPMRIGVGHLGHWAALAQPSGRTEPRELFAATLKAMRDGGTDLPTLGYYDAMEAALRGDVAAADARLEAAIVAGFRDPTAFDVDLAWRPFKDAPWLADARRAIDEAIAQDVERARAAGV